MSDDEQVPYRKKRGKLPKNFGIECKFTGPFGRGGWGRWQWYETAKQRDQALSDLRKTKTYVAMEFRAKDR